MGFARGVEIQADAILNPLFDPDELKKEAEVVIEESNRKLDNPTAVATERMYATAFTKHRMRRWSPLVWLTANARRRNNHK